MLYRIGTVKEIEFINDRFPKEVIQRLYHCTAVLDEAYGSDRLYLRSGGYSLLLETADDLKAVQSVIDPKTHPCEWVELLDDGYLYALYLLNNEFSIVIFMPTAIAPPTLLSDLED